MPKVPPVVAGPTFDQLPPTVSVLLPRFIRPKEVRLVKLPVSNKLELMLYTLVEEALKDRLLKQLVPATVIPATDNVAVPPFIVTVPPLGAKFPVALVKFPLMFKFADGAVTDPVVSRKVPAKSAALPRNV